MFDMSVPLFLTNPGWRIVAVENPGNVSVTIDDFYVVRKVSEGQGGEGGGDEGMNRAEGAKICIICIGFMVNRAEGAKFFGI